MTERRRKGAGKTFKELGKIMGKHKGWRETYEERQWEDIRTKDDGKTWQ